MLESWLLDLKFAVRRLRVRPVYALMSVLTLALGVGGSAAIYGIAHGLLFDPLPYAAEQEVAVFWMPFDWTEQEFLHLRGNFPGFRQVAAYRGDDATIERGDAPARLLPGIASSAELFGVLGVSPAAGRAFRPGDDALGAPPVVILSDGLWRDLGSDPAIIGERLKLDGVDRTVVGVMPRGFWFPDPETRVWFPAPLNPQSRSGNYTFIGRMAAGRTVAGMAAPLAQLTTMLKARFTYSPQWDKTREPKLTLVRESLIGSLRPALLATMAAMGLILLIACANVAALMLGQIEGRSMELAVRSALGADRLRLSQQLMAEALLVGGIAGAVGAALAAAAFRMLTGALPLGAWGEGARLDWTVFAAALAIALTAALLVALVPAFALWRGDLREVIGRGRTGGISGRGGRIESGLVVAEVALAVMMAAGAGLLVRSVAKLYAINPGVESRGLAVLDVVMPADMSMGRRRQTLSELTAGLGALPGARTAGAVQKLPLRGPGWSSGIQVEGREDPSRTTTFIRIVTPGYLETMGIALKDGRLFGEADRTRTDTVVVINQALAKKYFPGENPVGRRINTGFGNMATVIGVVTNVAEAKLTDDPAPVRYVLYEHIPFTPEGHTLVLRTTRPLDAASILTAARHAVEQVAPTVAVQQATTMEQVFAKSVGPARQIMILLSLLTGLALVLGAVGVYGVMSHFATRRQRDWGIRIALGLSPSKVITHLVGRGVTLVAAGVSVGLAGVVVMGRLLTTFLYGVGSADPVALSAAVAVLLSVGALAAFVPARRASRVDPAIVLRD